ncbi:TetR/AcrR family transcriptional regulator [Streptomyces sp. NPDC018031]|uniref:TetR/AcrR family transcriptional regulator n=1 Tax=Streptomyces sp. NPDC018031 TaxID=3365033 RepID=UPI00379216FE
MASVSRASRSHNSVWLSDRAVARRRPDPAPEEGQDTGRPRGQGGGPGRDQAAGLDRDRIVAATVRLLDAEGLTKFSMRRLAAELGVTAMSVYWYVDTKDDLLELALDQVNGEMVLPDVTDESADWRDQLRHITAQYRDLLVRHPWVPQLIGRYINIGPRSLAFSNATLRVMMRSGLAMEDRTGALSAVFQFVYGFATTEGLFNARCQESGVSIDDYFRDVMSAIETRPEFQETLQASTKAMDARGGRTVQEMRDRDFAFALDMLIAGIEAMRDRAR